LMGWVGLGEEKWTHVHLWLIGNSGISKNKGTSFWNSVPNSELGKFRVGISIVEMCYRLSSTKMDAQLVINWAVVAACDNRPLVYHSNRQALSTARFRRTGQMATADTLSFPSTTKLTRRSENTKEH